MVKVYSKANFNIYSDSKAYIVHNRNKEFSKGHTHLYNFKTAKYIIDLASHKTVPNHLNKYLLESIIRITDDKVYADKIRRKIRFN